MNVPTENLAIKLRKFNRICPITGYQEGSIRLGAPVIVQTDRGIEYGEITEFPLGLPKALSKDVRLKKVVRYATAQDVDKASLLPEMEIEGVKIAGQLARELELPIKIIDVEYLFDTNRLTVYYKVAEGKKVKTLRDLARDISAKLKSRVDMKQLTPRDEARIYGGLGPCGKSLCCSTWLEKPRHVTVKMVKEQGLAMSPTKTSGMCGRLMCCLEYEYEQKK
ncbi:MAG: regulatory iron-sulfur-containing complex subunit RicT [bacterium]